MPAATSAIHTDDGIARQHNVHEGTCVWREDGGCIRGGGWSGLARRNFLYVAIKYTLESAGERRGEMGMNMHFQQQQKRSQRTFGRMRG